MLNSFFRQYFRFKLPQENSEIRHLCAGSLIWRRIIFFCKFICRKPKPYIKYKSGKTFFYSLFPIINLYVCLLCSPMFMDLIYKICIHVFASYCYSIYLGCSLLFCLGFLKWGWMPREKMAKMLDSVLKNIEEIKYSCWPLLPTCALLWFHLCWMLWQANRIRHYS